MTFSLKSEVALACLAREATGCGVGQHIVLLVVGDFTSRYLPFTCAER